MSDFTTVCLIIALLGVATVLGVVANAVCRHEDRRKVNEEDRTIEKSL
jgi:cell division protein FtsL